MSDPRKSSLHPFVSIIIVNHNGKKWLQECLDSLAALNYPRSCYEVILGDNASTDDSVVYTRQNYPWIRIDQLPKNYGFCKGNNLAARQARGEYLAFLNNDTFVSPEWLKELVRTAREHDKAVLVASRILFAGRENKNLINSAGGILSPSGCGVYAGWMEIDGPEWDLVRETGFACGAGLLVEKDFFLRTGGFDEYYFYSGEEMDLGFRAWSMGYRVMYAAKARMYHYMGGSGFRTMQVTPSIEYLITRNTLYYILKNFGWIQVFTALCLYVPKAFGKFCYALWHRNWRVIYEMGRAEWTILKDIKKIFSARKMFQTLRKISDAELSKKGVIESISGIYARHKRIRGKMGEYSKGMPYYDNEDRVRVKIDSEGEMVFEKV